MMLKDPFQLAMFFVYTATLFLIGAATALLVQFTMVMGLTLASLSMTVFGTASLGAVGVGALLIWWQLLKELMLNKPSKS